MKTKLLLFALLVSCMSVNAQAPQSISYQAIARDISGNILSNQNISLRFSILNLSSSGSVLYSETHNVLTNSLGLISVNIGQGTIVSGTFSSIPWETGSKFLKAEIDVTGGSTFSDIGTQQLLSVPYALSSGDNKWSASGNNIFNNNTGNVGIGISVPQNKLEIKNPSDAVPTVLSVESQSGTGFSDGGQLHLKGSYRSGSVISGDTTGQIVFRGYLSPSNTFLPVAGIKSTIDGSTPFSLGGRLTFFTRTESDNALLPRMTIKNDGRIGIGTLFPGSFLDIRCPNVFTGNTHGNLNIMTTDPQNADVGGSITLGGNVNSAANNQAFFASIEGRKSSNAEGNVSGYLSFKTNNGGLAERMRITEIGRVGIGCSSPAYALHVIGDITAEGGVLRASSAIVNTSITACSDIRYKKRIEPLKNSIDKIKMLNGVSYYWKKEEFPDRDFSDGKQIGIIAQELEKVYPELVSTDANGYKSVDYSRLAPILLEAVKEQQQTIEALKNDILKINSILQNELCQLQSKMRE